MNGDPVSRTEDPKGLPAILHDLSEACLCQEAQFLRCLFCEAREQLETQDRALRLAQSDLAKVRPLAQALDASLRWSYRDTGDLVREPKPPQFDAALSQSFRMDVLTMRAGWKIAKGIV